MGGPTFIYAAQIRGISFPGVGSGAGSCLGFAGIVQDPKKGGRLCRRQTKNSPVMYPLTLRLADLHEASRFGPVFVGSVVRLTLARLGLASRLG